MRMIPASYMLAVPVNKKLDPAISERLKRHEKGLQIFTPGFLVNRRVDFWPHGRNNNVMRCRNGRIRTDDDN